MRAARSAIVVLGLLTVVLLAGGAAANPATDSLLLTGEAPRLTVDERAVTPPGVRAPGAEQVAVQYVANHGGSARLRLAAVARDRPGGDVRLSAALRLTVTDLTGPIHQVYEGPLTAFGTQALGRLPGGTQRVFRITVRWPAGADHAALQGTGVDIGFRWTATGA